MKIRKTLGMPEQHVTSFNPFAFDEGAGAGGGTNPPAPATPPAPPAPVTPPPVAGALAAVGPHGFPESTPVAEMTDAQASKYWHHYAKQHRSEADQLKAWREANEAKVTGYEALEAASRTDAERAVEAAKADGEKVGKAAAEQALAAKYAAPLVQSRFEVVLAGRMTPAQVATLVGGLNVAAFLGTDGLPDTTKITDFVTSTVPVAPPGQIPPVNLGGGRTAPVASGGLQAGADLYDQRKSKPRA
jgi:hypothetical protein